ncbi:MAG: thiamine pyrophosphate-binding protein [Alphaproteobacteria bacterium]|nr:thiamine pyrophosphate-binding protein [Alphaproteobacteria bacterium]
MSERMTGGRAIVEAVVRHGVDTVFGLPGAQIYPLFDALAQAKNRVRTITPRHEQAAGYMAYGYAKSTGRPGVYAVVPGPGVLNTAAALCTAWGCNAPVLCLTGQVPSEFLGRGRGHLHELPDQLATMRTLVKWAQRVDQPGDTPHLVDEAFRQMQTGRPGPASLEMCWDVMATKAPVTFNGALQGTATPDVDPEAIDAAAAILNDAKTPMIMVGGGAQHASEEVLALADTLDAPVTAFRSGRGIVSEDHELGVSAAAAFELWSDTDVLIGIGSRLELQYMRWAGMNRYIDRPDSPPRLIRIDIDPLEMTRLKPHAGIVADAADGARALSAAVDGARRDRERIAAAKISARKKIEPIQPQMAYLDAIRDVLPDDGFFVEELCQVGFASNFGFPVRTPRTYVTPGFQGTLGFGYPTALGVKIGNPDRAVVSINGDGGFMFGVQELATAAQYGIGVVALVFNNGAFGNVRRDQKSIFDGRVIGADFVNPDFVKLADSFGVRSARVASPEALKPVLEEAIASDAPALIDIEIVPDSEASPWSIIHPWAN